jgi:hypothetical protein
MHLKLNRDIAKQLILTPQWAFAMRHTFFTSDGKTTPFREMIRKMPGKTISGKSIMRLYSGPSHIRTSFIRMLGLSEQRIEVDWVMIAIIMLLYPCMCSKLLFGIAATAS